MLPAITAGLFADFVELHFAPHPMSHVAEMVMVAAANQYQTSLILFLPLAPRRAGGFYFFHRIFSIFSPAASIF